MDTGRRDPRSTSARECVPQGNFRRSEPNEREDRDRAGASQSEDLGELLAEARILLPEAQVFLAFLTVLPFTDRFAVLSSTQRAVYLCTFFTTLLAFTC